MKNDYLPWPAVIEEVIAETADVKTFCLRLKDKQRRTIRYQPGQFLMVSRPGFTEAPFTFASSYRRGGGFQVSVKNAGSLTNALHGLKVNDVVGVRGPYGNSFPLEKMRHRDLLFVAGGIGLAPLRPAIQQVMENRKEFGKVEIVYGCRTPQDLVYKDELSSWRESPRTKVHLTVDVADKSWDGASGVVCVLFPKIRLNPKTAAVFLCGPGVMVRFATADCLKMGYKEGNIYIPLERSMRCGIGKCGHCYLGDKYVCTDGPVFSCAELKELRAAEVAC